MTLLPEPRVSFDGQASAYEERAGIPEAICRQVASQLLEGVPPSATVVDVGAGTGTIGRHLVSHAIHYLALDVSRPMLAQFSRSLSTTSPRALLLQVDADGAWPIKERSANVILFSRSAHLLKSERALGEVLRVAAPGCRIWVGRVRRPRESAGEQMKRTMQHLLREQNLPGRNGERAKRDFLEALESHGARKLGARSTDSFIESEAPIDSIVSWKGKSGLGGRPVSDETKAAILVEVERWAREQLGDLTTPRPVAQCYELEGVQVAE